MIRKIRNRLGYVRGFGGCHRCGNSWSYAKHHTTYYTDTTGCFPLCEPCWSVLTPEERLPFYGDLMRMWLCDMQPPPDDAYRIKILDDWELIKRAVIAGG